MTNDANIRMKRGTLESVNVQLILIFHSIWPGIIGGGGHNRGGGGGGADIIGSGVHGQTSILQCDYIGHNVHGKTKCL